MGSGFVITPAPKAQEIAIEDALAPFRAQLEDPLVTDVFVNGSRGMFIDRGFGTEPVPDWTASEREVRELASELIAQGGRHVDDAHPCVDVRLRGGIRVHAVLAPIATAGTTLSIRIPRFAATTLSTLVEQGMIDHSVEAVLREAVARRANLLVSGAAGVGKTTLLSALLGEAPPMERIVTIEDVAEIALDHPHHVALESRQANLEGAGEVGLARLVREALRMKPDRLVVGECRGVEVRELLSALNTGHDGGAGTVHANSLADVATRLEALGALAGLDETTLARQVTSAIEFVIHLERDANGYRRVAAVGEFRIVDGRLFVVPKEIPQTPAPVMTRRSRRRAVVAAESPTPALPAGFTGGARGGTELPHEARGGAPAAGEAEEIPSSGIGGQAGSAASDRRFIPPRTLASQELPRRRDSSSSDQDDVADDRPLRQSVARSHFTTDGDWHRVAAVRPGSLPIRTISDNRFDGSASARTSDESSLHTAEETGKPAFRGRRATSTAGSPRATAKATSTGPAEGGVLPTFDEWRERLRITPRSDGASANGAPRVSLREREQIVDRGNPAHPSPARDSDADEAQAWSEPSMRALRAPREAPTLSPAELDAQWDRLIAGWDASGTVGNGRGVGLPHPSEHSAPAAPPVRERHRGGAWTFVPVPSAPAASESAAHAGR
ncbi:TadA family conjugal transfer-associated ATPase [Microbacterium gorillae]|uniref:TadA family conjugal transfer-associated ATPase n=1 Tax=Microbacterium gorillae TaxID=1231063 RepID=UPI003D970C6B